MARATVDRGAFGFSGFSANRSASNPIFRGSGFGTGTSTQAGGLGLDFFGFAFGFGLAASMVSATAAPESGLSGAGSAVGAGVSGAGVGSGAIGFKGGGTTIPDSCDSGIGGGGMMRSFPSESLGRVGLPGGRGFGGTSSALAGGGSEAVVPS
jgi:hypothetical protein